MNLVHTATLNTAGNDSAASGNGEDVLDGHQERLLDDSTSAVDTDTDHRIQLALKERLGNMTTIIIAQRFSSIREADRILIMNDGKIGDSGTHEELLERNEVYRDLYQTQMEGVAE